MMQIFSFGAETGAYLLGLHNRGRSLKEECIKRVQQAMVLNRSGTPLCCALTGKTPIDPVLVSCCNRLFSRVVLQDQKYCPLCPYPNPAIPLPTIKSYLEKAAPTTRAPPPEKRVDLERAHLTQELAKRAEKEGDLSLASHCYELAIHYGADNVEVRETLAALYKKLKLQPDDKRQRENLFSLLLPYLQANRFSEAYDILSQIEYLQPVQFLVAALLCETLPPEEAKAFVKKVFQTFPFFMKYSPKEFFLQNFPLLIKHRAEYIQFLITTPPFVTDDDLKSHIYDLLNYYLQLSSPPIFDYLQILIRLLEKEIKTNPNRDNIVVWRCHHYLKSAKQKYNKSFLTKIFPNHRESFAFLITSIIALGSYLFKLSEKERNEKSGICIFISLALILFAISALHVETLRLNQKNSQ